jgi:hypothetical protein
MGPMFFEAGDTLLQSGITLPGVRLDTALADLLAR